MDPDVRGKGPAKCPRCGMTLVPGIPDFLEFPVRIETKPRVIKPGADVQLSFDVLDPKTQKRVNRFERRSNSSKVILLRFIFFRFGQQFRNRPALDFSRLEQLHLLNTGTVF